MKNMILYIIAIISAPFFVCADNNVSKFSNELYIEIFDTTNICLTPSYYDLGRVDTFEVYNYYFSIENKSDDTIRITKIVCPSKSTEVSWVKNPYKSIGYSGNLPLNKDYLDIKNWVYESADDIVVKPNSRELFIVNFDTFNLKGKIEKKINIFSDAFVRHFKTISFSADVNPLDTFKINFSNTGSICVDTNDVCLDESFENALFYIPDGVGPAYIDSLFSFNTLGYDLGFYFRSTYPGGHRKSEFIKLYLQEENPSKNILIANYNIQDIENFDNPLSVASGNRLSADINRRSTRYRVCGRSVVKLCFGNGPLSPPYEYVIITFIAYIKGVKYHWSEEFYFYNTSDVINLHSKIKERREQ